MIDKETPNVKSKAEAVRTIVGLVQLAIGIATLTILIAVHFL